MREITFTTSAHKEFESWKTDDKKIYAKIIELLKSIKQDPFTGIGKPEPLNHQIKSCGAGE
jgi:toxin YoeB